MSVTCSSLWTTGNGVNAGGFVLLWYLVACACLIAWLDWSWLNFISTFYWGTDEATRVVTFRGSTRLATYPTSLPLTWSASAQPCQMMAFSQLRGSENQRPWVQRWSQFEIFDWGGEATLAESRHPFSSLSNVMFQPFKAQLSRQLPGCGMKYLGWNVFNSFFNAWFNKSSTPLPLKKFLCRQWISRTPCSKTTSSNPKAKFCKYKLSTLSS